MFGLFKRKNPLESGKLSPEADAFLAASMSEFNLKQTALASDWSFTNYEKWDFDQYSGMLVLTLADGSRVLADGQILGSHSSRGGSWEWAWNNPNVEAKMATASYKLKELGSRLGISYLVHGKIPVEGDALISYLCATGVKATDSDGAFMGSAGPINVYLLVSNMRRA